MLNSNERKDYETKNYILWIASGLLLGISSCSLDYEPLDTYSDVTEGITDNGTKIVFKDKAAVESHLTTLYNQMRDRQEHWYVDLLLIADSHSDNAYARYYGSGVVTFEIILLKDRFCIGA